MTLPKWTTLVSICCALSDLVSSSNGFCHGLSSENWTINLTEKEFHVAKSSNITINCSVTYAPPEESKKNIQGFWKAIGKGEVETKSFDKRAFIFHPNDSFVLKRFRGRTRLLGNVSDGNCSLFISNTQSSDAGEYYFRVETGTNQFSFIKKTIKSKYPQSFQRS
ncbi:hypothetical protein NFI96_019431 [Prochilodus magdalenae]|nr:hypothetical protein NFI96_019431 [Prochilodus magdalenae]